MVQIGSRKTRQTCQRRVILEELRAAKGHPTAAELHDAVRRQLPRISLGTVYRNLEFLATLGLVHRLEYGAGPCRYDAVTEPHYHVRCTRCGCLDDACGHVDKSLEAAFQNTNGYEITGHRLELTGLCPKCKGECQCRPQ